MDVRRGNRRGYIQDLVAVVVENELVVPVDAQAIYVHERPIRLTAYPKAPAADQPREQGMATVADVHSLPIAVIDRSDGGSVKSRISAPHLLIRLQRAAER